MKNLQEDLESKDLQMFQDDDNIKKFSEEISNKILGELRKQTQKRVEQFLEMKFKYSNQSTNPTSSLMSQSGMHGSNSRQNLKAQLNKANNYLSVADLQNQINMRHSPRSIKQQQQQQILLTDSASQRSTVNPKLTKSQKNLASSKSQLLEKRKGSGQLRPARPRCPLI